MTKKNKDLTYEKFKEKTSKYINNEQMKLIDKAYLMASSKHFGELRLTGDDYIVYLLNIAYILSELFADYETICAALLQDNIETEEEKQEIKEIFGPNIVRLIEGVITVSNLKFKGEGEKAVANHRKILVGMCEDVRIIVILLAKRLYNMRTLWVLPEKEQKEESLETLEIFVPIAHRLGMNKLKSELDDLSLRYSKPDVYFQIVEQLNQTKSERDEIVLKMQQDVSKLLTENHIKHEIKGRAKSIYSIYKKLDTGRPFSDIFDLLALRIFVKTEAECYQVMGIIHSRYRPIPKRFKDYIAMPKSNMYQSLHTTVFGLDGYLFEIQIRTYEMDKVAENGIASHWSYKEKIDGSAILDEMNQKLQFFRSIIELNEEQNNDEEFVKSVEEDIFKNNIYVFTKDGDVIELPTGSTPIDFAYKVHTKIGDKMVGAIVNNTIVPLDYELQDNDVVKINTNNNSLGPSKEWINIAKTNHAKNKIKNFFNKIDKNENIKKGEEILHKELRKRKIPLNDFLKDENINKILENLKIKDLQELYFGIGNNSILINQVINILTNESKTKEDLILNKIINKDSKNIMSKDDIIVEGIHKIKTTIASCCRPIPQDRIVGYITKGNGVTVHRMICPNVSNQKERIIDTKWNNQINKKYPTTIIVYAKDEKNTLLDIISKTSNNNITVDSIKTIKNSEDVIYHITVLVENKEKLLKFMNDIKAISNISNVERYIN